MARKIEPRDRQMAMMQVPIMQTIIMPMVMTQTVMTQAVMTQTVIIQGFSNPRQQTAAQAVVAAVPEPPRDLP
jgi:hypothetical protein